MLIDLVGYLLLALFFCTLGIPVIGILIAVLRGK